ncbi:MAG: GNAT family N-acetyltransferase, partial [Chloroflexia bacterium]|nr:GNAT family N-acetyltransferase [Chloroflexia bacterium]
APPSGVLAILSRIAINSSSLAGILSTETAGWFLNWANNYHRLYWSQFIQEKQHKLKYRSDNQKTNKKYSIMRVSYKNSLYQKELNFLQNSLTYSLDYYNADWKQLHEKSWHFIATDIHKIIGCAVFMPNENSKIGELILIAVDENWRRKGLGKELINEIITHSKYKSISKIYCSSFAEHVPFLRKMDFKGN